LGADQRRHLGQRERQDAAARRTAASDHCHATYSSDGERCVPSPFPSVRVLGQVAHLLRRIRQGGGAVYWYSLPGC